MLGIMLTVIILMVVFLIAMLIGVMAYGFTLAPVIIHAILTYWAIKWLLKEFRMYKN